MEGQEKKSFLNLEAIVKCNECSVLKSKELRDKNILLVNEKLSKTLNKTNKKNNEFFNV